MPIGDADSTVAGAIVEVVEGDRATIKPAAIATESRAPKETQVNKGITGDGQDLKLRCLGGSFQKLP